MTCLMWIGFLDSDTLDITDYAFNINHNTFTENCLLTSTISNDISSLS